MKRSSRFSRAQLARFAPFVVAAPVLALGIGGAFVDCIPNPDISGLPPFDGSVATMDAAIFTVDGGTDATISFEAGPTGDAAPSEASVSTGTLSGAVIDYTQGNGKGVVPGAIITVTAPSDATVSLTTTTDVNGLFTIPSVPAGIALEVGVFKATDTTSNTAYSSTALVVNVASGQTVNVFPVIHEGCFQNVDQADAGLHTVNFQNASCPGPRGSSFFSMTFGPGSFDDPSLAGTPIYSGAVRVEAIALAYPATSGVPDLSWAIGLPGAASPPGLLGAAEYRVVKANGDPLTIHAGATVTIAVPMYQSASATSLFSFSGTTAAWASESAATTPGTPDSGTNPAPFVSFAAPHLGWFAATNQGMTPSTCVKGVIQAGGSPLANVLVHGVGGNYLGSSTGVTNAAGLFCLDVGAQSGDGGQSEITIFPQALVGGVAYGTAPASFNVSAVGAGSCATGAGCTSLGAAITLNPSLTCVSGTIASSGASNASATLDVELVQIPLAGAQESAGVRPQAYIGQTAYSADAGAFCALAPPGGSITLSDPATGCEAPNGGPFQVQNGATAVACGSPGCLDAGALTFGCP